ncbi:IST1-LIKE 8 [Hibiscus trionum]|uniref:IST1-LIKE 8 n=1 Tax=Hibiscus trionum TaxID=183268 RepID=A0A9W7LQ83_HIBTR|nr:IST1-LIKE 8 [Hibiscus trionum]
MFDLLLKPKFYSKCKSSLRINKVRLETIRKKRNAVEKYLKKDIAELLRNGLDYNAYGRIEGLMVEQNRTACYHFIEQFSLCISKNVSVMQKQSECPEECREAIASVIHAAARFADLPELRTLRTLFTEKYRNSLEPYLSQEFVQKLQAEPPTKEMKLESMHAIANEFSIEWDSKALEQQLFEPPPPEQNKALHESLNEGDDDGYKSYRSKNDTVQKSNDHNDKNDLSNMQEYWRPLRNEMDCRSRTRKEVAGDKLEQHGSSEFELTDQDIPNTSSTSEASFPDDGTENMKPFYYRSIPPPYVKLSADISKGKSSAEELKSPSCNIHNEKIDKPNGSTVESKPKPRSVRSRRTLKPPPSRDNPVEQSTKLDPSSPPGNAASIPKEVSSPTETEGRNTQASSFKRDVCAESALQKLPDYDDLRTQLEAIQRSKRN